MAMRLTYKVYENALTFANQAAMRAYVELEIHCRQLRGPLDALIYICSITMSRKGQGWTLK